MANMTFGVNIIPKANTSVTLGNSDNPWEIVSPDLTGTPTAPTATAGTNTTQIATTAFVQTAASDKADKTDTVLETTLSRGRKANTTVGANSFAFGYNVVASGVSSHAEGAGTTASGSYSHAEGNNTTASTYDSHAEGYETVASGYHSHAEGYESAASEHSSHAEGYKSFAKGFSSHAEGCNTFALGDYSHAQGNSTISNSELMTSLGKYNLVNFPTTSVPEWSSVSTYYPGDIVKLTNNNVETYYMALVENQNKTPAGTYGPDPIWTIIPYHDKTLIESVGYGNDIQDRGNIRSLDIAGNEYLKGSLYVGCNNDLSGGKSIVDLIYPVGSIYMSVNNTSPATLFGGTWQQIQDTFLLAAGSTYSAGGTGGSASVTYTPTGGNAAVTLTTNQIPSHNHTFTGSAVTSGNNSVDHTHNYTDYYATTTGGTSITTAQLASHAHGQYVTKADSSGSAGREDMKSLTTSKAYLQGTDTSSAGSGSAHTHSGANTSTTRTSVKQSANHTHSVTASGSIGNTGGGQSHNHTFTGNQATIATMPPYLTVYMWQRTA